MPATLSRGVTRKDGWAANETQTEALPDITTEEDVQEEKEE